METKLEIADDKNVNENNWENKKQSKERKAAAKNKVDIKELIVELQDNDESQDGELMKIRGKFFTSFLNPEFIKKSHDYCFPYKGLNTKRNNQMLESDPIFKMIKFWSNTDDSTTGNYYIGGVESESQKKNKQSEGDKLKTIEISLFNSTILGNDYITKTNLDQEKHFVFSKKMDNILSTQFSDFGTFKDFEHLIKVGISFYRDFDEIERFDSMFHLNGNKNTRLEEIVLAKMEEKLKLVDLYTAEMDVINRINEEIDEKLTEYKVLYKNEDMNYEISIKHDQVGKSAEQSHVELNLEQKKGKINLYMKKDYEMAYLSKLIKIIHEYDSYQKWICSVLKPTPKFSFLNKTSSKKIYHLIYDNELFQKRDLILYSFVNNKLRYKDSKSFQFVCRSISNKENAFQGTYELKEDKDVIRMDLNFCSFEIKIIDEKSFSLIGLIEIDTKLQKLEPNYIEILGRQYMKDFFKQIDELLHDDNKFKSAIRTEVKNEEFYLFVVKEFWKHFKIPLNFK